MNNIIYHVVQNTQTKWAHRDMSAERTSETSVGETARRQTLFRIVCMISIYDI